MAGEPQEILLPPEPYPVYRRPAFIAILIISLGLFYLWLPVAARAALFVTMRTQWVLITMLLAFGLIAVSLVWSAGQRLDTRVFLFFNLHGYRAVWLDRVMWMATQIGNFVTAIALAVLFFILHHRGLAVMIILGTLTLWLVVETVKALTDRDRPFLVVEGSRVIGWREPGRSFPSGHTAQTFFLATLLYLNLFRDVLHLGLGVAFALYLVAVLVGVTRVFVGAHYPRDVMGGAILGSIWGLVVTRVDPYWLGVLVGPALGDWLIG
jgi:membrane-associated phospholipid phosphatase